MNNTGVHATHCCKECGCKYGDEECPVALGQIESIECWECRDSFEQMIEEIKRKNEDSSSKGYIHRE